jgi:hypothetical protein
VQQNSEGDIVISILDGNATELVQSVSKMFSRLKEEGKNKVLWWNNRSVLLNVADQYG